MYSPQVSCFPCKDLWIDTGIIYIRLCSDMDDEDFALLLGALTQEVTLDGDQVGVTLWQSVLLH